MIIRPQLAQRYPSFTARFGKAMTMLETDAELWSLLTTEGRLSNMSARDVVRVGQIVPRLQVTPLATSLSHFDPSYPDDVDVSMELARHAEADTTAEAPIRYAVVAATGALIDRALARRGLAVPTPPWSMRILPNVLGDDWDDQLWGAGAGAARDGKAIMLSATDRDALARLAVAEAGIQVRHGVPARTAYGSVVDAVVNRIASEWSFWGTTVDAVVDQPSQFEPVDKTDGKTWRELPRASQSQQAVVDGYLRDRAAGSSTIVGPATHFLNPKVPHTAHALSTWARNRPNAIIIGRAPHAHVFWNADTYRPKPHHVVLV
ncbi:MAG: cell wall hydrolase [Pseudomonadota bacterium]